MLEAIVQHRDGRTVRTCSNCRKHPIYVSLDEDLGIPATMKSQLVVTVTA
jgi:hypothetical protein